MARGTGLAGGGGENESKPGKRKGGVFSRGKKKNIGKGMVTSTGKKPYIIQKKL